MKFVVVGRQTLTTYGPFESREEARAFRKAKRVGLGSSKRWYAIVPLVSGDFVTAPLAAQAAAEAAVGL